MQRDLATFKLQLDEELQMRFLEHENRMRDSFKEMIAPMWEKTKHASETSERLEQEQRQMNEFLINVDLSLKKQIERN